MFRIFSLALLAALPARARAAEPPEELALTPDRIDAYGLSGFHLTTRGMFADGSTWATEARVKIRLADRLAISAVAPLGIRVGSRDAGTQTFFGNLAVGLSLGGILSDRTGPAFSAAGAFDLYFPTAPNPEDIEVQIVRSAVPALRAYEPQLYLPRMFSGRLRGHVGMTLQDLHASFELGLIPGTTVDAREGGFVLLMATAARMSARLGMMEPYLEIDCALQIAGKGQVTPPLWLTPGLRLHFADAFAPALFVSVNFVDASAVAAGVDLASLFRPSKVTARADRDDFDDFLN